MRNNFGARVIVFFLWCLLAVSLACFGFYLAYGNATPALFLVDVAGLDLAFTLRIDALSTLMFMTISFLMAVVGQYALRYLDGEERQWYFYRWLLVTVTSVTMLVLSSNLLMFFIAWWCMSWGLHHLLLYNEHRKAAVYAARKKLLVSRLGDLAVMGAIFFTYRACGSFDFRDIFALAEGAHGPLSDVQIFSFNVAGVLLAFGAMIKSAQFPFHFWLPETMETPTPVSALMHAGIINAGGFLTIRLSPIMSHATFACLILALVGAFSAVYGSLVMMTQNNVKKKLAYSTISQMGMMLFACGLGAYALALFHIIAHSFYKAHAFLSTGDLVEESKRLSLPLRPLKRVYRLLAIAGGALILIVVARWEANTWLATAAYGVVLLLALLQSLSYLAFELKPLGRTLGFLLLAGIIYAAMERGLYAWTITELSRVPGSNPWIMSAVALCYLIFVAGFWLSNELMRPRGPRMQKLYARLWNDSHFGVRTSRLLARIWPV